jgi:DNA repair protein REV1
VLCFFCSIKAGRLLSIASYKLIAQQTTSLSAFSAVLTRSTSVTSTENSAPNDENSEDATDEDTEERRGNTKEDAESGGGDSDENNRDKKDEGGEEGWEEWGDAEMFGELDEENFMEEDEQSVGVTDFDEREKDKTNSAKTLTLSRKQTKNPSFKGKSPVSENSGTSAAAPSFPTGVSLSAASPKKNSSASSSFTAAQARSPSKAGDPKFLSEFYSHSRLHHISTWGAEFRAYVNKLQKESSGHFPGRERLRAFHEEIVEESGGGGGEGEGVAVGSLKRGKLQRVIMHADMDCFFVSVGLLSHPELKG